MITVAEARALLATLPAGGIETVPLGRACGRVLARRILADRDWPPFTTSAMDGYAVRLCDLGGAAGTLQEGQPAVMAGDPIPASLPAGIAIRVMTGAPLPPGSDAVIPVEQSSRQSGRVRFQAVPRPGANIRQRGESIAAGTELLPAGRRLSPSAVALLAVAGADPAPVFRQPAVALAVTGNEVVATTARPGESELRDSNGPMLAALCRARGWPVGEVRHVPDEASAVTALFEEAGKTAGVLITTGGVSAGDLDLLPGAAARAGFEILFHGVAMRPGKPVILCRRGETLWFGLPGNPVSASVAFQLFVREALDRIEGDADPGPEHFDAVLAANLPPTGPRETYRDARLSREKGEIRVIALASAGSHDLAAHACADALIRTPAGAPALPAGERVECIRLSAALESF